MPLALPCLFFFITKLFETFTLLVSIFFIFVRNCEGTDVLPQQLPTFLAPGTGFMEDNSSMDQGWGGEGMVPGWFKHIVLLWALFPGCGNLRIFCLDFRVRVHAPVEANATADLTGGGAQLVTQETGSSCKHRRSLTHLPTAHLPLWGLDWGFLFHPTSQDPRLGVRHKSPGSQTNDFTTHATRGSLSFPLMLVLFKSRRWQSGQEDAACSVFLSQLRDFELRELSPFIMGCKQCLTSVPGETSPLLHWVAHNLPSALKGDTIPIFQVCSFSKTSLKNSP